MLKVKMTSTPIHYQGPVIGLRVTPCVVVFDVEAKEFTRAEQLEQGAMFEDFLANTVASGVYDGLFFAMKRKREEEDE